VDTRLQKVAGKRIVRLRYSDAPKVAQAIVDKMQGKARVLSGMSHDTPYIQFVREGFYSLVIHGEDWRFIFPFIRYGSGFFTPVTPPGVRPTVPSPQPNRDMPAPPENPGQGLTTFLEHFSYDEYVKIQGLLTSSNLQQGGMDLYSRLVLVLQQLFPTDFPTYQM
jgi:hypothetical protein